MNKKIRLGLLLILSFSNVLFLSPLTIPLIIIDFLALTHAQSMSIWILTFIISFIYLLVGKQIIVLWSDYVTIKKLMTYIKAFPDCSFKLFIEKDFVPVSKNAFANIISGYLHKRKVLILFTICKEGGVKPFDFKSISSKNFNFIVLNEDPKTLTLHRQFMLEHEFQHGTLESRFRFEYGFNALSIFAIVFPFIFVKLNFDILALALFFISVLIFCIIKFYIYPKLQPKADLADEINSDAKAVAVFAKEKLAKLSFETLIKFISLDENLKGKPELIKIRSENLIHNVEKVKAGQKPDTFFINRKDFKGQGNNMGVYFCLYIDNNGIKFAHIHRVNNILYINSSYV